MWWQHERQESWQSEVMCPSAFGRRRASGKRRELYNITALPLLLGLREGDKRRGGSKGVAGEGTNSIRNSVTVGLHQRDNTRTTVLGGTVESPEG